MTEYTKGICTTCLKELDPSEYSECSGCSRILLDDEHRHAGWCDACGTELFGDDWRNVLLEDVDKSRYYASPIAEHQAALF